MELEIGNWKWSSNKEMVVNFLSIKLTCQHRYDAMGRKFGSSHAITAGLIVLYDFVHSGIAISGPTRAS